MTRIENYTRNLIDTYLEYKKVEHPDNGYMVGRIRVLRDVLDVWRCHEQRYLLGYSGGDKDAQIQHDLRKENIRILNKLIEDCEEIL